MYFRLASISDFLSSTPKARVTGIAMPGESVLRVELGVHERWTSTKISEPCPQWDL